MWPLNLQRVKHFTLAKKYRGSKVKTHVKDNAGQTEKQFCYFAKEKKLTAFPDILGKRGKWITQPQWWESGWR